MTSRIAKIIEYSGLSARSFALKCGINQPTLFNQLKGLRSVSLDTVLAIGSAFPEISRNWLLYGEGEMTTQITQTKEMERINKLTNIVESLQEVIDSKNATIAELTEKIKQLSK